jgi:predicted phosphoribosyltransferase
MMPFEDRREAGRALAGRLGAYAGRRDVIVLGLPRGGVPVAAEVARALHAPLDVLVVRKLGVPGHEELALGAVASGGFCVLNDSIVRDLGLGEATIERVARTEGAELARRERVFRGDRPAPDVGAKIVVLVDDGIATGATMRSAVAALRGAPPGRSPARLVVATPVAAPDAAEALRREADEVVCLGTPPDFLAVGRWYRDFPQTSDAEVRESLAAAAERERAERERAASEGARRGREGSS